MSCTLIDNNLSIIETSVSLVGKNQKRRKDDLPRGIAEIEALESFKSEVQDLQVPVGEDYFLLRFLRARALDIPKAKDMLKKYLKFRATNKYLADICHTSYILTEYILKEIPFFRFGNDFDGRPAYVVQVGHADLKGIFDSGGKDDLLRAVHYVLELLVHCSEVQRKKHGCTKFVLIADFDGLSFRNAFHTQSAQTLVYLARTFEAFYPEMLHLAIAVNANWLFNSLYCMMKPFLSAETVEKVQIYGYEKKKWASVLKKYIPEQVIPEEYGGGSLSVENGNWNAFEGFRPRLEIS